MTRAEKLQEQVDDGHEAALILQYAGKLLLQREEQIIREMLQWFDGLAQNPVTDRPEVGVRFIARLSAVRELLTAAEHREKKGAQALAEIVSKSTGS